MQSNPKMQVHKMHSLQCVSSWPCHFSCNVSQFINFYAIRDYNTFNNKFTECLDQKEMVKKCLILCLMLVVQHLCLRLSQMHHWHHLSHWMKLGYCCLLDHKLSLIIYFYCELSHWQWLSFVIETFLTILICLLNVNYHGKSVK